MIIEVEKTYTVSNKNKKTVVEVEMYRHKDNDLRGVNTEIVWRTGEFSIYIESLPFLTFLLIKFTIN